jgi:hypothetical protein
MVQIHAGKQSSKLVAYGMKSESQTPNALEDLVREHGAPNCLFSDKAKVQIGKRACDILCLHCIKDFQHEPEHQHQNFSERMIGDVKRSSSGIMDRTGTPAAFWLLCLFCVIFLLNHMLSDALGGMTPVEEATGVKADVSPLLKFHWWEPISCQAKGAFPSDSRKKGGSWCGVVETQGDILTHLVLTDDAKEGIARSATSGLPRTLLNQISMLCLVLGRRKQTMLPFPLCILHPA